MFHNTSNMTQSMYGEVKKIVFKSEVVQELRAADTQKSCTKTIWRRYNQVTLEPRNKEPQGKWKNHSGRTANLNQTDFKSCAMWQKDCWVENILLRKLAIHKYAVQKTPDVKKARPSWKHHLMFNTCLFGACDSKVWH